MKYYAVRKGITTGIFTSWDDCKASVSGYSGAEYKSFPSLAQAQAYLDRDAGETFETDRIAIYVDGSYNSVTEEFSYGMVVLLPEGEITFSQKYTDAALSSMHNVAGEIKGAEAAIQYALDHHLKKIAIYHDYEGIAKWCLGQWKATKDGTKAYRAFYENACKQVDVQFVKVTGHSGDRYNNLADHLAKEALGLS